MKSLKNLVFAMMFVLIASAITSDLQAIPAFPKPVTKIQSNGKTLTYQIYGDEHISWATTLDGYTLLNNDKGDMVYAIIDKQGNLIASEVVASNEDSRSAKEISFVTTLQKGLFFSKNQVEQRNQKRVNRDNFNKQTPLKKFTTDKPRLLVILVSYDSLDFDSANAVQFKHQIQDSAYTQNGFTGSVRDYFADNSYQAINPQFDVYGPITLPHTRSYYAEQGNAKAWEMARDAAKIIDTMHNVDFSVYDNDNDGVIDLVHIIYAGIGANSTNQIEQQVWPHMYYFMNQTTLDGKRFHRYACSSELTLQMSGWTATQVVDGIGAVCHEMGHAFGLPDMYDTDYDQGGTEAVHPATWDVMATGSYNNNSKTPPYYSMIERDMIGWGKIIDLTQGEHRLYPIADSNTAYKIHLNKNEYLMFEYRNHDKWDAYIPGVGMLVWHADTSQFINWEMTNKVNADPDDRGCYIECAGNESHLESASTPFPGSLNITSMDVFTLTDGTQVDGKIIDIHYDLADSSILFTYRPFDVVRFESNTSNVTSTSIDITLKYNSEEVTISDRIFQYRKEGETQYTTLNIAADSTLITLNNLERNTKYNYRLGAKGNGVQYYSVTKTFRTRCTDDVINTFPYTETFENGMNCWVSDGEDAEWTLHNRVTLWGGTVYAYAGQWSVALVKKQNNDNEAKAVLISPMMDLSEYKGAKISFAHVEISGVSPSMKVMYRLNENDAWTTLSTYTTRMQGYNIFTNWLVDSVYVPKVSSTFQIAFEGADNYLAGVLLDNITIDADTTNSALIEVADNEQLQLNIIPNPANSEATIYINNVDSPTQIVIFDASGRIMDTKILAKGEKQIQLDTKTYNAGIYYIRAVNEKVVNTIKFVKID